MLLPNIHCNTHCNTHCWGATHTATHTHSHNWGVLQCVLGSNTHNTTRRCPTTHRCPLSVSHTHNTQAPHLYTSLTCVAAIGTFVAALQQNAKKMRICTHRSRLLRQYVHLLQHCNSMRERRCMSVHIDVKDSHLFTSLDVKDARERSHFTLHIADAPLSRQKSCLACGTQELSESGHTRARGMQVNASKGL